VHGSAPDIAGKGLANPTAILLSSIQMLQYMGLIGYASSIQNALESALADGVKTRDLGGTASTSEFTAGIIARLDLEGVEDKTIDARSNAAAKAPTLIAEDWQLVGADVFVENHGLPQMPEKIGPFTLRLISNRGTKVWPGATPDILLVDHFRNRYVAETSVTRADVLALLQELTALGKHWCHVELLNQVAGEARYSKAQGE
jgi:hypothetical protein